MTFTLHQKSANIYHLRFASTHEMCATMLRFQEHFESPKFRGKVFTLKEFKAWYKTTTADNSFSYYTDWSGFNFPSRVITPFLLGHFGPLSKREQGLLKALSKIEGKFYLIATLGDDLSALRHELGHALYYTDMKYKKAVDHIISKLPLTEYPKKKIRDLGYHASVLSDELHAFLIDGFTYFNTRVGMSQFFNDRVIKQYKVASERLNRNLNLFLKKTLF